MTHPPLEINGVRTWIEIDTKAVKQNYQALRRLIGKNCRLMAVVKSNAYGHDLIQFSRLMERLGADWLGVDSIVEGLTLRRQGIKIPLLVLGYTLPQRFAEARTQQISLTISSFENLRRLTPAGPNFHLKIDTGMNRQGFLPADLPRVLRGLKEKRISPERFEGLYTHFAAAKNPAFPQTTRDQMTLFQRASALVGQAGYRPLRHAAATGGALLFPESRLDLVRVGIGLYGLWPSRETKSALENQIRLRPALSWKTIVGETKMVPTGAKVGYDQTWAAEKRTRLAIAPVGYWHGYDRRLSSIGSAYIRGKKTRVAGRVSMDMLTLDLGLKTNVKPGDVVTLIGPRFGAEDFAALTDTSVYEIITRLNPLIRRILL